MISVLSSRFLGPLSCSFMTFAGGEEHVVLNTLGEQDILIDARINSSSEFMRLLAVTDAARRQGVMRISLFLPYFPGARQDRVDPGTGFALTAKIVASILNAQRYDKVMIVDPHSDVTPSLLDACITIPLKTIFPYAMAECMPGYRPDFIISPDAGAVKRATEIAHLYKIPLVTASKKRDPGTGKLSGFFLPPLPRVGQYLVVDDICDGGGTFLGLAEAFEKDSMASVSTITLWVTHGIFSQGLHELAKRFDHVISTDSFPNGQTSDPFYRQYALEHYIKATW